MTKPPPIWSFLRAHLGVFAVLIAACLIGVWFAFGVLRDIHYFNDPRNQDETLKPWMTPRYVVMSYDLPRQYVAETLGLTSIGQRHMSMNEIAALNGVTLSELTAKVRMAAEIYRTRGGK